MLDATGKLDSTAHVFLCRPELIGDRALLARYETLLDSAERSRFARFRIQRDAHMFLIAHALVRTALSQFADIPPGEWRFKTNEYGRPEIDSPAGSITLRFNLSHCNGLIACVVAANQNCGVDVEEIRNTGDLLDLAECHFAGSEVASLRTCPPYMSADRFFSFWTLKEAYIKARGMGVALPLDKFSFRVSGGRITVRIDPIIGDQEANWTFLLSRPTPMHFLATALRNEPRGAQCRLVSRWFVPLIGPQNELSPCQVASSSAAEIA